MAIRLGIGETVDAAFERQNAQRAQRDSQALEQLAEFRRQQTRDRSRNIGELAGDSALGLLSGAVGLGQAAYGLGNIATGGFLDEATGGFSQNFPQTQQQIREWQSEPLQLRRQDANAAMDESLGEGARAYATDPSLLADLAFQGAPSLIPSVAGANLAARVVGGVAGRQAAQQAATRAAIGVSGAQIAGATNVDAVNTLREQGVEGGERQALGIGAGLTAGVLGAGLARLTGAGALEGAVGRRLAGLGGTGGGVVRGAAGGAVREAVEEAAQSATETASVNLVAPDNELLEGTGRAAVMGGLAGGVLGGPLGAFSGGTSGQGQPDADTTPAATPQPTTDLFGRQPQWDAIVQAQDAVERARLAGAITDAQAEEYQLGLKMEQEQLDLQMEQEDGFRLGQQATQEQLDLQQNEDFSLGEQVTQGELELTPEEQQAFVFGEQLIQGELLLEDDQGNVTVNEEQRELFNQATQGMTTEQQNEAIQQIAQARQRAREIGDAVRQRVEQTTGVTDTTGLTEDDFLTGRQAQAQARAEQQEQVISEIYRVTEDEEGQPVYQRYNEDIQAMETVPRGQAVREANRVIAEREAAAAEAARPPAERWRDVLSADLGVPKKVLQSRNREWSAFAEAANERGIQPGSPEAEAFLVEQAAILGADEAGAKRFAAALGERYAPALTEPEVTPEPQLSERAAASVAPQVADGRADVTPDLALLSERYRAFRDSKLTRGASSSDVMLRDEFFANEIEASSDIETLETSWQTILQSPEFQTLPENEQNDLTQKYSDRYDAIEPGRFMRVDPNDGAVIDSRTAAQRAEGSPAAPSRSPNRRERRAARKRERQQAQQTPLTPEVAQDMLSQVEGVQVHESVAAYKEATGRAAPADAAGAFDLDGVHVIMSNVRSQEHLAELLAHERAHKGLDALLADRLPAVTNRLWANAALRERIRAKMREQSLDRSVAAEEVLADMIAANERLTGDVWSKVRSGIQSAFESLLGVGQYRVTDRQVDALLDDVARQMRGEASTTRATALTQGEIPLDVLLGDPAPVTNTARFSRALEVLNSTVPENNPAPGNYNQLSQAVKEATDATKTRFSSVWADVKSGNFTRALAPFMPLNQMVNMWGRNFDRVIRNDAGDILETQNPLREFSRLKGEQEAHMNQRLVRKRNLNLDGEQFEVSAHDIADAASSYQLSNPNGARALNVVLQESSYFQLWPQKSWDEQPGIDYTRYNMSVDERKAAHRELQRAYRTMGAEGQTLYRQIQAAYKDMWQSRIAALEGELRRVNGGELPTNNRLLELARRELTGGPYSPLARHGRYLVVVRNADGNTEHFSAYDTPTEAEHARNALAREYPGEEGFSVARTLQDNGTHLTAGLNQEQLNMLESALEGAVPNDADPSIRQSIHDAMIETYLKMIPASSFGKYSNRRKNVSGYSLDGVRAFSEYAMKAARQIASIEHDGQLSNALQDMSTMVREREMENAHRLQRGEPPLDNINTELERDVVNKVREQHEAALGNNFNKLASMLSGAGFLYMMTSPSQLFVNASQTFIVAMPRLAGRYGGASTLRVGNEALRNFFRSGRDFLNERAETAGAIDPTTQSVMQRLYEDGTLDFTLSHDLTDTARGESGQLRSGWRKTMEFMSFAIHRSEVFNRQVTAYMATKLHAERNGIDLRNPNASQVDELYRVAKDAVDSTQFNYSQSNKPAIMQGPIRRLVFQFQQYRLNMLAMMAKDLRDAFGGNKATPEERALARRSLAYMLGTQLAMTGAVGTAMAPIAFAIMDAFGDDDEDFVDSRTAFIQAVPQWMAHGMIGGVLNLDPSRVEVGSVLPFLGERTYAPNTDDFSETAAYYLERNIGPWYGLTTGALAGVRELFDGNVYEAGQGLLPKPMSDVFKAIHEREGVRNKQGVITYDTGAWDTVVRAVGLRSQGMLDAQTRAGAGYQAAKNIERQRQNRLVELAVSRATGDDVAYGEAMDSIRDWNEKNPEFAIRGQDIGRIFTSQTRAQRNVRDTGVPLSRVITPEFRQAAGI